MSILRPTEHMSRVAKEFPGVWRLLDNQRERRGKDLPRWLDWSYLPLPAVWGLFPEFRQPESDEKKYKAWLRADQLCAVYSWRATQGVYRFDPTLFMELWWTPTEGNLPTDLFYLLPEWCLYVEVPEIYHLVVDGPLDKKALLRGFFVYLNYDPKFPEGELRFVTDYDKLGLIQCRLPLKYATVEEALAEKNFKPAEEAGAGVNSLAAGGQRYLGSYDYWNALLSKLLTLVIYICAVNADIRNSDGTDRLPCKPRPKRTKRGYRLFPASNPSVWEVGYHIGPALKAARARTDSQRPDTPGSGTRNKPRAHLRRGHFRNQPYGPRNNPHYRVKWIYPTLVGLSQDELDNLIPTVRKVKGD